MFLPRDAYATCMHSVVMLWPDVCPSVRHKPVLYRNCWAGRAGIPHSGYPRPILHCIIREFEYLSLQTGERLSVTLSQTLNVADFTLFRHGTSTVASLLNRASNFVYTTWPWYIASRGTSATLSFSSSCNYRALTCRYNPQLSYDVRQQVRPGRLRLATDSAQLHPRMVPARSAGRHTVRPALRIPSRHGNLPALARAPSRNKSQGLKNESKTSAVI